MAKDERIEADFHSVSHAIPRGRNRTLEEVLLGDQHKDQPV
jgi:hypothetical protein